MNTRPPLIALVFALLLAAPATAMQGPTTTVATVSDTAFAPALTHVADCQLSSGNCTGGTCYINVGTCWDYCTFNIAATCQGNCPWNIAGTCTETGACWINIAAPCLGHCDLSTLGLCITIFAPLRITQSSGAATQGYVLVDAAGPCLLWLGSECALRVGPGGEPYGCQVAVGSGQTEVRIFCG